MYAFVVERVICLAESILEEFLPVQRICWLNAALGIHAEAVVIADGVVKLHSQILLRLAVQIEQTCSPRPAHGQPIKDVIAALDRKIAFYRACLLEAVVTALGGVQLRLKM